MGHVHLFPSGLRGTVSQPAPVGRQAILNDSRLRRWRQQDGDRLSIPRRWHRPYPTAWAALRHVDKVLSIGGPLWREQRARWSRRIALQQHFLLSAPAGETGTERSPVDQSRTALFHINHLLPIGRPGGRQVGRAAEREPGAGSARDIVDPDVGLM